MTKASNFEGLNLPQGVMASLSKWHEMVHAVQSGNGLLEGLETIIHPQAVFKSPAVFKPYEGREALCHILRTVITVFQSFEYDREFVTRDGMSVVLEFSASVNDRQLFGADFIRFDDHGLIVEFMVMIRPASGLMALGEKMSQALVDGQKI